MNYIYTARLINNKIESILINTFFLFSMNNNCSFRSYDVNNDDLNWYSLQVMFLQMTFPHTCTDNLLFLLPRFLLYLQKIRNYQYIRKLHY